MAEDSKRPTTFVPMEFEQGPSLLFVWRRKWIVLLVTLVGLGLGYLYYLREKPVYQSSSQILLVQRQAKLPIEGLDVKTGYEGRTGPDLTHESVIASPIVAKLAVDKFGLKSLPSLEQSGDPAMSVVAGLDVKLGGTKRNKGDVIELKYSGSNPDDCPKVLEAVVAAYQAFLGSTYNDVSEEAISLIVQAKDELDRQLSETEAAYRKFRFDVPLLFNKTSGENLHETRLSQIEEVRSAAVLENAKTQAKIDAIEETLKRGGSRAALRLMVGNDSKLQEGAGESSLEKDLFPALLEEQTLLESLGPDHPKVVAVRKRIAMTREHMVGLGAAGKDANAKQADFLDIYVESLREQMKLNQQTVEEMSTLFENEREASKSLAAHQVSDETFRSELDRKRRLFDAIIKRLEEINLVKDAQKAKIQLIQPPKHGIQIKPDLRKISLYSTLLGLMAGLGLALLIDRADRRYRSPDEIREELGVPVVGHIPVIAKSKHARKKGKSGEEGSKISPILCTVHHPRGRNSEAYRAVRTALYFSGRGTGHQVIQITSPNPGDGKTTLASNLAISVAQSGKSVLLVDADFRRPRCHRLFKINNERGFADVLAGNVELADALQAMDVANLTVLPCGHRPDNPSELLTSPRFEELIQVLREKFEFVIVDTPPILSVTDPLNVAPRVDGLVLVMRLTKSARSSCGRAVATLDELGAKVLGVVVNGLGGGIAGYGSYRGYGYGPGYGYGYSYGYRYGYGRDKGYAYGYSDVDGAHKKYYEDSEPKSNGKAIALAPNGNGQDPH